MKKILLILALGHLGHIGAQTVIIPDANFVTYLQSIIPGAMNGNQMDTTNSLVTTTTHTIHIPTNSIANLFGLQYFSSLTYLNISQNPNPGGPTPNTFSTIPTLPSTLLYLDCSGNYSNLTAVPALPNGLQTLSCGFCGSITTLPTLPNSLTALYCASSGITCFPPFPSSITSLNIGYNPYNCLPNYNPQMTPAELATPLCAAGNSNGCPVANDIQQLHLRNLQVAIYPNPTSDQFFIDANTTDKLNVNLFDVNGRCVLSKNLFNKEVIDVTNLNEGVYTMTIKTIERVITRKLVVIR